jgi:hypothetical protein
MNQRKNSTLHFFLLFVLVTLACSAGASSPQSDASPQEQSAPAVEASSSPTATASGLCDNPLMIVRTGASWTYTSTGSPSGDFTYTDTITDLRADGFTLRTQFTDLTRTQEWECDPGGLRALQLGGGSSASIIAQDTTSEFRTLEVSGYSYPRQVTPGIQWEYRLVFEGYTATPSSQQTPSQGMFTAAMQEAGRETVTVPAGTFEATKFQSTSTVLVTVEFQGIQIPFTVQNSSVIWYAPGVGFIKSIENSDIGGEPSTIVTELMSYSIP